MRHRLRLNLIAIWIRQVLGVLCGIVIMPLTLHRIGDGNYGVWLFVGSLFSYSGLLNLGFGGTISRYVADLQARREWLRLNQVVNVTLAVYIVMSGVAMALTAGLIWMAPSLSAWEQVPLQEVRIVLFLLGLNIAIGMVGSVFGGILMGLQRFDVELMIEIPNILLRLILIVLFVHADGGLVVLAMISLLLTFVEHAVTITMACRSLPTLRISPRLFSRDVLRECMSFSSFSFLNTIAEQLIHATDTIVIGLMLGPEAIVPYHIGLRLTNYISSPIQQIGMVAMPRAGELAATGQLLQMRRLVNRGVGLAFLLIMGAFVGAGFFGPLVIRTWIGSGYEASHVVLLILMAARLIATPLGVLRSVLFGLGDVRYPALIHVGEAVCNLVLSLILIGPLGIVGVALGTLIPMLVFELALLLPYAMRLLELGWRQVVRDILSPQVLPLVALLGYCLVVQFVSNPMTGWIPVLLVSAGGLSVVGTVWFMAYRFGWNLASGSMVSVKGSLP